MGNKQPYEKNNVFKDISSYFDDDGHVDGDDDDEHGDDDDDGDEDGDVDLGCLLLLSAKGASQPVDDQRRESVQPLSFNTMMMMIMVIMVIVIIMNNDGDYNE